MKIIYNIYNIHSIYFVYIYIFYICVFKNDFHKPVLGSTLIKDWHIKM